MKTAANSVAATETAVESSAALEATKTNKIGMEVLNRELIARATLVARPGLVARVSRSGVAG